MRFVKPVAMFSLIIILFLLSLPIHAAREVTTITLAVRDAARTEFTARTLALFEAQNPDIHVQLVKLPDFDSSTTQNNSEVNYAHQLSSSADVININSVMLSEAMTRTGFFLDLKPLTDVDAAFKAGDYFPKVWQSWTWDNAVWGLPGSFDVTGFVYDRTAFDAAGLAYPAPNWTMADLSRTVQALVQKGADGNITRYGLQGYADRGLLRSLISVNLFDSALTPNAPNIDQAQIAPVVAQYAALKRSGFIAPDLLTEAPLAVESLSAVYRLSDQSHMAALLPGGRAEISSSGYAISSATQYVQQAYRLARFLANVPEFSAIANPIPGQQAAGSAYISRLQPDIQVIIKQAIDNALSGAEERYVEYVLDALDQLSANDVNLNIDASVILQSAQQAAVQAMQVASQKPAVALVVATPIPEPTRRAGYIELTFGMQTDPPKLPNQAEWDAIIADFIQHNPEVDQITLDLNGQGQDDCGYQARAIYSGSALRFLKPLDPLTDIDSTFNKTDFLNGVLAQMQFDNKTWGYPLNIQPEVLVYNAAAFMKAGVPLPGQSWSINQFVTALKILHTDSATPVFVSNAVLDGTAILLLVAAYGGLPIDYRTSPPTLNFTSAENVDAIRQVLDLVKGGFIKYASSTDANARVMLPTKFTAPIETTSLTLSGYRELNKESSGYQVTNYPHGTRYTPLSYSVASAYILATTAYPDACYRWIKTLANHPELFGAMPTRHSQINDPAIASLQGTDAAALYKQFEQLLTAPNLVSLTSGIRTYPELVVQRWLLTAFNKYVQKGEDLQVALQDAEVLSKGFLTCLADIPPYNPPDPQGNYLNGVKECAVKLDATTSPLFDIVPH